MNNKKKTMASGRPEEEGEQGHIVLLTHSPSSMRMKGLRGRERHTGHLVYQWLFARKGLRKGCRVLLASYCCSSPQP